MQEVIVSLLLNIAFRHCALFIMPFLSYIPLDARKFRCNVGLLGLGLLFLREQLFLMLMLISYNSIIFTVVSLPIH